MIDDPERVATKIVRQADFTAFTDEDAFESGLFLHRVVAKMEEVPKGRSVVLPAHAVPGWPPEVPLPVDPAWKKDYAASIQRLIRDGVDVPLADLFVHAARTFEPGATGVHRARSASESFLFGRLESLPQTKGRARLNAVLQIPFNERGVMEVDFLFDREKVVLELDGSQHLADPEAYRRDRRKDYLLQENGYLVLRVLAEDVSKKLDTLLDSLFRALNTRAGEKNP